MVTMKVMVQDFLSQKRIAVVGVSRSEQTVPANLIYRKLRTAGYQVFPVNPNAKTVEGDVCYADLRSIPGGVDGAVISTQPQKSEQVVRQCVELGIQRVWMHRSFGKGSFSEEAAQFCRDNRIKVITSGCPMMYCPPVDFGHKCMKWMLGMTGKIPK